MNCWSLREALGSSLPRILTPSLQLQDEHRHKLLIHFDCKPLLSQSTSRSFLVLVINTNLQNHYNDGNSLIYSQISFNTVLKITCHKTSTLSRKKNSMHFLQRNFFGIKIIFSIFIFHRKISQEIQRVRSAICDMAHTITCPFYTCTCNFN